MSDLRGLSRGGKTAAVVILVVLLQVIVVAVLGLGAISRDREEGARIAGDRARENAERAATTTLDQMRDGLRRTVMGLASTAVTAREPGAMRSVPREDWSRAFTEAYRVDARGRFRSFGGRTLYVPPDVAAEEEQKADAARLQQIEETLARTPKVDLKKPQSLPMRREYARQFWFRTDPDVQYPRAAGEALAIAEEAAEAVAKAEPGEASSRADFEAADAILTAFEVACMNEGWKANPRDLSYIQQKLDAVVATLPAASREMLSQSLQDLRRARQSLASIRDWVLREAKDMAQAPAPPKIYPAKDDDVIAVAPLSRTGAGPSEALVVRIDRRILAARAEVDEAGPPGRRSGLSTRVVPRSDPAPEAVAFRLPLQAAPDFDAGLDVLVLRSEPLGAPVGPREAFYLTILGLATLGLTIAAMVLWRIYRREVHLARLKADFVSNLSHELKTPLTSISMFVEMIREGRLTTPEEMREGMEVIAQESDRLQRIVTRMIEVARREAEPVRHDLVPGDLNAAVRSACERFRRLERHPGLSLIVDLAQGLPPVRLDPAAMDDAVTNLLSNAWKYRNGDAAKIRVTTRPARRRVELVVEDDGIGIPRAERRRIFEMFYRADDYLSRGVPGTGLGLALVKTIVRAHRGTVRVDGSPGRGTAFRIRLPAAKGAVPAPPPSATAAAPPAAASPAARSRLGGSR